MQRRALPRLFASPAAEADWEAVYADLLPRVYNFFRYRVEDDLTYFLSSADVPESDLLRIANSMQ